jgi:hypothetical protein
MRDNQKAYTPRSILGAIALLVFMALCYGVLNAVLFFAAGWYP